LEELVEEYAHAWKRLTYLVEQSGGSGQVVGVAKPFQFAQRPGESLHAAGNAGADQFVRGSRQGVA
jgi:hypothetical protein